MSGKKKSISISINPDLLKEIDETAKKNYRSRSSEIEKRLNESKEQKDDKKDDKKAA